MQPDGDVRSGGTAADSRTFSEIASSVIHDFQDFFRAEARLAIAELKENARNYGKAGGLLAIAGLFGFFAFACFTTTLVVGLSMVLPLWLAALIIGILYGFIAGGAFLIGRVALDRLDPLPQRTLRLLKETMERVGDRTK